MNMPAPLPALRPVHRTKFHPRQDILDEVVAGLLWMQLDLPDDITRDEMQAFAHRMVSRIQAGAGDATIAVDIAGLQSTQLGRPANLPIIRDLAARAIAVVRGAH
jgi:hypothetical protein